MKKNKEKYIAGKYPKYMNPDMWKNILIVLWTFVVTVCATTGAYIITSSNLIAVLVGLCVPIVGIYMCVVESFGGKN